MGSGNKFRISWMHPNHISLSLSVMYRGEHELSIHIDLIKISIYIGFGKGYEEF